MQDAAVSKLRSKCVCRNHPQIKLALQLFKALDKDLIQKQLHLKAKIKNITLFIFAEKSEYDFFSYFVADKG